MKKIVSVVFILFYSSCIYPELYEVRFNNSDFETKLKASMMDILSGSSNEDSENVLVIESSPQEIMCLNGFAEIRELPGQLEMLPEYSNLELINIRIDHAAEMSSGHAKVYDIGESIEGRKIKAVRISKSKNTVDDMPEVLYVGMHHAREWISSEVTLGILEFLVKNMDSNAFVSDILENSVMWFVPMLNPDGYVFSFENERMWRHNRRVHPDESIGVDLNRNYDSSWIMVDYVHGTGPFSEPETSAVKNLILNDFDTQMPDGIKSLDGLITYHSYGQIIMYPPGSNEEHTEKQTYYKNLAEKMSLHAFSECGSAYLVMQASQLYYTFGEMTEWFMNTHEGKPAFTVELRPHMGSDYFFMLPADQIRDTVKENITPALYLARHIITGEIELVMDVDGNGVNDVIENTFFDYFCDRSDLESKDEVSNDEDGAPDEKNDHSEQDIEKNDSEDETNTTTSSTEKGCTIIITQEL